MKRSQARLIALVSIVGILLPLAASGQSSKRYGTDLDSTEPARYSVEMPGHDGQLRRLRPESDARSKVLGQFRSVADLTGGSDFHFFPNGKSAITRWCDICPVATVATGDWQLKENEVILTVTRPASARSLDSLNERFGAVVRLAVFVVAKGDFIGETVLVSPEMLKTRPAPIFRYLVRREPYLDWQPTYERLRISETN